MIFLCYHLLLSPVKCKLFTASELLSNSNIRIFFFFCSFHQVPKTSPDCIKDCQNCSSSLTADSAPRNAASTLSGTDLIGKANWALHFAFITKLVYNFCHDTSRLWRWIFYRKLISLTSITAFPVTPNLCELRYWTVQWKVIKESCGFVSMVQQEQ